MLCYGLGVVAFAIVGAVAWYARSTAAYRVQDPPVVTKPEGPRIWYPVGRLPALAMPDGGHRVVRSVLRTPRRMRYGEYVWNDDNIPAGVAWIRIDLARQLISVFRGDNEIGTAVILYGTDGKPTPTGTFPIIERQSDHYSSLYDAPMPYMLRLTADGVAIHASNVQRGSATHGCIGVPPEFARLLFDAVRRGDPVFILPPDTAPSPTA